MDINHFIEKTYPLLKSEGNKKQKTLYFKTNTKKILPGQFYMLHYEGDQKPFSVSHFKDGVLGITIEDRGRVSGKMINAGIGDYFGLTGPLGSAFTTGGTVNPLLIGGGIGSAPVYYLAMFLIENNIRPRVLLGARNRDHLIYAEGLKKICDLELYTDDGTLGEKGFVTKNLDSILEKNNFDRLYLCGPEIMMKIVLDRVSDNFKSIEVSMERYMKCGLGICGSCVLDDIGLRVCREGPVFDYHSILKKSGEFGNYHRNKDGIKEKI